MPLKKLLGIMFMMIGIFWYGHISMTEQSKKKVEDDDRQVLLANGKQLSTFGSSAPTTLSEKSSLGNNGSS